MSDRYHRHPTGNVCRGDTGACIDLPAVVVLDPAYLPHGWDLAELRKDAAYLSGANATRDHDRADLLTWLADLIEQAAPPVAEPSGDCVVRDSCGQLWARNGAYWSRSERPSLTVSWSNLLDEDGPLTVLRPEAGE